MAALAFAIAAPASAQDRYAHYRHYRHDNHSAHYAHHRHYRRYARSEGRQIVVHPQQKAAQPYKTWGPAAAVGSVVGGAGQAVQGVFNGAGSVVSGVVGGVFGGAGALLGYPSGYSQTYAPGYAYNPGYGYNSGAGYASAVTVTAVLSAPRSQRPSTRPARSSPRRSSGVSAAFNGTPATGYTAVGYAPATYNAGYGYAPGYSYSGPFGPVGSVVAAPLNAAGTIVAAPFQWVGGAFGGTPAATGAPAYSYESHVPAQQAAYVGHCDLVAGNRVCSP